MLFYKKQIVQMLWYGPISTMERLCIASHLKVGHEVHLYCYEPYDLPGVKLMDAREIIPEDGIFAYSTGEEKGSFSAFSNCFRYKLLFERGNWWSDTDVICLKRFDFTEDYVFASEKNKDGTQKPTTSVMKAPVNSNLMRYCYQESISPSRNTLRWGTIGPKLLGQGVENYQLTAFVQPYHVFCPYDWFLSEVDPEGEIFAPTNMEHSYAIHLWQEMWRRAGLNKDGTYGENTLYERLKRAIL